MHDRIIFWDYDGTLINSGNQIIKLVNEEFNTSVQPNSWSAWNFEDCFHQIKQNEILKHFRNPNFFKNLEFIDENMLGILKVLDKLKFEQKIITIGCEENIKLKKEWIKENLPFFNLNDSHFLIQEGMGKGCVDLSDGILIDDAIENLDTSNAWHKICFGKVTEYNQQAEELGYLRTKTSLELLSHILELIKRGDIK